MYIDQPIGTGFSYGTETVNSTEGAAPPVWKAFQLLFESGQFAKYQSRECVKSILRTRVFVDGYCCRFIFTTESYGGHYGRELSLSVEAISIMLTQRLSTSGFRYLLQRTKYRDRQWKPARGENCRERSDD